MNIYETSDEAWIIRSFAIQAIYIGPEVIKNTTLASIEHEIPVKLNLVPRLSVLPIALSCCSSLLVGPVLIIVGIAELSFGRDSTVLAIGISITSVAAICSISGCVFLKMTEHKEEQFRREVKAQLTTELLETGKKTAEERIQAAREARTFRVE